MPWMNVDARWRSTGRPSANRPGTVDHPAVVAQPALAVEHRHVQPAVVRPVPRRPHDRTELARGEVCLRPRRAGEPGRREPLGIAEPAVATGRERPLVEGVEQPGQLQIGQGEHVAQTSGEQRPAVAHRGPAADHLYAESRQRVQVERRPFRCAGQLRRRQPPGTFEVVDLAVALRPDTGRIHPPQHVAAAVQARHAHVLADRQGHRPSRAGDLGGQLHARCRRAHHQHPRVRQLGRAAVVERRQLLHRSGDRAGEGGDAGSVARSGGDDDRSAAQVAAVGAHEVAVVRRPDGRDGRPGPHRGRRRPGEPVDEVDDLGHRRVAVRVRARVAVPGQPAQPIRGEQPQRVPALAAPGVGDVAPFEHDVVDGTIGEEPAGGKARMPGPDNDRGEAFYDCPVNVR